MLRQVYLIFIFGVVSILPLISQQVVDTVYNPIISVREYPDKNGPTIHIDRGHRNFHTRQGGFRPFADVLVKDGYQVVDYNGNFTSENLSDVEILIVANALSRNSRSPFVSPTESAFTAVEIEVIEKWVDQGGSLFLIADHMPFAGASSLLAKELGFDFTDSFVFDKEDEGIFDFRRENGMLSDNLISNGRDSIEYINHVRTFTGQGFRIPDQAVSILNLTEDHVVLFPDTMWVFNEETIELEGKGFSQGAYMEKGEGRLVVFGEAAMFTGQLAGPDQIKVGMNAVDAEENYKLLLNIIHWLDGLY